MSPIGLATFFTFMTIAEGSGQKALKRKFMEVSPLRDYSFQGYLPALKANYCVWPVVQIVNFSFMPLPLQIPFVNMVGVFWYVVITVLTSGTCI